MAKSTSNTTSTENMLTATNLSRALFRNDFSVYDEFTSLPDNEFEKVFEEADGWYQLLNGNYFHSLKFLEKAFKCLSPSQISHYILLSADYDMEKFKECLNLYVEKMSFYETAVFLISMDDAEGLTKLFNVKDNQQKFKKMLENGHESNQKNLWHMAIEKYAFNCEEVIKRFGKMVKVCS